MLDQKNLINQYLASVDRKILEELLISLIDRNDRLENEVYFHAIKFFQPKTDSSNSIGGENYRKLIKDSVQSMSTHVKECIHDWKDYVEEGDLDEYFETLSNVVKCVKSSGANWETELKPYFRSLLNTEIEKFEEENAYPLHEIYERGDFDSIIERVLI